MPEFSSTVLPDTVLPTSYLYTFTELRFNTTKIHLSRDILPS